MWRSVLGFGLLGVLWTSVACSSSDSNGSSGAGGTGGGLVFNAGSGGGGTSGAGSGTGAMPGTSGNNGTSGAAGSCPITVNDAGCSGELYVGETIPLDIYIMFDQSGSMLNMEQGGLTRMDAVRDAVGKFVNDPKSTGMGVGIGYFGYKPIGSTSCNPADYEKEAVPIGRL